MASRRSKYLNRFGRTPEEQLTNIVALLMGTSWWRGATSVFVLSTGRSGTETLARVLDCSPQIRAYHEPRPRLLAERKAAFSRIWSEPEEFASIFARARANPIGSARLGGKVYAETSARLGFFAPVIADLMPRALFVHLHRHPGEVIRSGMRRRWYQGHAGDVVRLVPGKDDPAFHDWDCWDAFTKMCWHWDACNRFAIRFRRSLDKSRILVLCSKELFDLRASAIVRLFRFIGIPCPARETIQAILSAKHNSQTANDFPQFDEWEEHQRETMRRIATSTMTKLGYVSDASETGEAPGCD